MKTLHIVSPRGFCFGVSRAVDTVRRALSDHGAPVFVYHEIVHNKAVLAELSELGAVFVESLDDADASRPLVLPAHGVSKQVEAAARARHEIVLDATCSFVKKNHRKIESFPGDCEIIIVGDENHAENRGLRGRISKNVHFARNAGDADRLAIPENSRIGVVSQTTMDADEVLEIVSRIRGRFGAADVPASADLCEATKDRQAAVKNAARRADMAVVVGSKNSSNSNNLKNAALGAGARRAALVDCAAEFDFSMLDGCDRITLTAGASTPERLVREFVGIFKERYPGGIVYDDGGEK